MLLSKRPLKQQVILNYYQQLTKVFLVSKNFLFQAYTWDKLFGMISSADEATVQKYVKGFWD
jgi:translation initiation factor 3 subunit A